MANVKILATLADIEDFVRTCSKLEDVEGFNVLASKHPGKSYVLAKTEVHKKPAHVLPIMMDYFHPVERPLIANAIHRGLYGYDMDAQAMEDEMVKEEH